MRPIVVLTAVALVAACASSGTSGGGNKSAPVDYDPSHPGPNQVVIYKFIFFPKVLTIPIGTTITWINHDIAAHTATRNGGEGQFESGNLSYMGTFHHTFATLGTYKYICFYHPGMQASIVVLDSAAYKAAQNAPPKRSD